MWSQPATARLITALKSNGNFDGKYYSKGRAGQSISQTVRRMNGSASTASSSQATQFHPLIDEVIEQLTARVHRPMPPHAAWTTEAREDAAGRASSDHTIVLEEGNTMSQLAPIHRSAADAHITAIAAPPTASVGATPFAYVPELVTTLLQPLVESTEPSQVRSLEKALTIAKGTLAKSLTRARNELIGILRAAPFGVITSPEARVDEILWNACSADLEQQLMSATHTRRGRSQPSKVIEELLAQVRHRVELATIEASDMVEIAKIQASLPPAPTRGYEPCWGEVNGVKPFGAFILLPSGESGLLHVSEMHPLDGGRRVDDATQLVNVGQSLYVKVTGKNDKGQLNFALVSGA